MENLNLEVVKYLLKHMKGKGVVLEYYVCAQSEGSMEQDSILVRVLAPKKETRIIEISVQDGNLNKGVDWERVGTAHCVNTNKKVAVKLEDITKISKLDALLVNMARA